ncbi:MAG: sigma-70 family RNA polymerase sigma factor [Planctomycetota bacterium]
MSDNPKTNADHSGSADETVASMANGENEPLVQDLGFGARDSDCVASALKGDEDAFRELMERYLWSIVSCAYSICHERERARDIAQEAFIEAAGALNELREPAKFGAWVYGIAKKKALALTRKESRRSRSLENNAEFLASRFRQSRPDDAATDDERRRLVREAMFDLPDTYREVLLLKYVEERSYEEIAHILEITPSAIDKRLTRAKTLLRKKLKSMGD